MSLTQYLLEFSICLALFYGLYHFLLRKETFFQLNRWYLLLTPAMAMMIPFLNLELPKETAQNNWDQVIYPLVSNVQEPQMIFWQMVEAPAQSGWSITYLDVLLLIYLIGVLWMASKLIYRTWRLLRLIGEGKKEVQKGYTLITVKEDLPVASFLSYVFWEDGPLSPERKTILQHELVHVQQWHSLDVLLMEIWVLLKWFHPFIYWYRKSLRLTHEYIADDYVTKAGESRLAYAQLLTNCKIDTPSNDLVHHFHSSIKMRLIMMAKKKSSTWKYLRLLAIIPVTMTLLGLFSFDLAEELPNSIVSPLQQVETSISDLANQAILSEDQTDIATVKDKAYKLKWGEIECDCISGKVSNLYRCKNQSMHPKELRRLIRQYGGFELLLGENRDTILELIARSKFAKKWRKYESQFDEMQQGFHSNSPFWKQAKKGDVFHFYFDNAKGDHFEFDVVINNRKEEFVFGHEVEIGDYRFNLDLLNNYTNVPVDLKALKKTIRVRKSSDSYYPLSRVRITNRKAMRQEEWMDINSTELAIGQSKAILEAIPGDVIKVEILADDGQKLNFSIFERKSPTKDVALRDFYLQWGSYSHDLFDYKTRRVYSKEEIEKLLEEDLYLSVNGKKYLLNDVDLEISSVIRYAGKSPKLMGFQAYKREVKSGQVVDILPNKNAGNYLIPKFRFLVDYDWEEFFADTPQASVSADQNKITFQFEPEDDVLELLREKRFILYTYGFKVEGSENSKTFIYRDLIEKHLENSELGPKLVFVREE